MIYRYSTVHLATIVLLGIISALTALLFSTVITICLLLSCVGSFLFVTILCYHQYGESFRRKLTQLLLITFCEIKTGKKQCHRPVSALIHYESQKIVRFVVRDFVMSWYSTISNDKQLPRDVIMLLQHVALELYFRLQKVDLNDLIIQILPVINPFLSTLNEVGYTTNNNIPIYDINHPNCVILFEKNPLLTHPALKSSDTEVQYLQKLVDSYLLSVIPSQYLKCDIALQLIRDALVHRLLKPLFDLLCDPNFLIDCIPLILSKLPQEKAQQILANITEENSSTIIPQLSEDDGLLSSIIIDTLSKSNNTNVFWEECDNNEPAVAVADDNVLVQSVSLPCEDIIHIPLPSVYINRYVSVDNKDGVHVGYIVKVCLLLL